MHQQAARLVVIVLCTLLFCACDANTDKQTSVTAQNTAGPSDTTGAKPLEDDSPAALARLVEEFSAGYYEMNPDVAVDNGLHDYDGQIPDYSAAAIQAAVNWYRDMQGRVQAIDEAALSEREWLHKQQLEVVIDSSLFYLVEMKVMDNNAWFGYSALDPDIYLSRDYAPLAQRMQAFTRHVTAMTAALPAIRGNLQAMPATHAVLMHDFLAGLGEFVVTTPQEVFAEVSDDTLQAEMNAATRAAATASAELAAWVEALPRDENFALGEARYRQMLWALERIDTPLDEMKRLAQVDLARNLAAMDEACAAFSPGASIADCIARAGANKFDDGPVAGAGRQLEMLRQVLEAKDIVSIPGDEAALVKEAPPHQRANAAYISRPGPYEKGLPSIYYIAPPDPAWSEAEQLAYIPGKMDLLATSIHEVWPGHFLEGLHSNRSGNPVSELASSYAFTEGWAHYSEELMVDEVLAHDAEMKIGQLGNALLRNVRFVASLGLHTGGMSVEEAEQLFAEKAFKDPGNARQQAARGTFDPGYLFYTVGKLMIRKLRADWMQQYPDQSLRAFHDRFLSYGAAPVPLIRKMMLGSQDDGKLFEALGPVDGEAG